MNQSELIEFTEVLYWFREISRIPRGSGNTVHISNFLAEFGEKRNLEYIQDDVGNVILIKEASAGYEEEEPLILQGHMDMVAVKKEGCTKDLVHEGLDLEIKDGYLFAKDTSLGGDDGIAVAYMLAILNAEKLSHPRLEMIITIDEETGMDGARHIDLSMLQGKRLLNIDSEEEGIFLAGCAGGGRVRCSLSKKTEVVSGVGFEITVGGLIGGHSGTEIQKNRLNANKIMGEILQEISKKFAIQLYSMDGGEADNAIPVSCKASFLISNWNDERIEERIREILQERTKFWKIQEPYISLHCQNNGTKVLECVTSIGTKDVLEYMVILPNGVWKMSEKIQGFVETSLNLGVVKLEHGEWNGVYAVRSSIEEEKVFLVEEIEKISERFGAKCIKTGMYPGWEYRCDSPLREKMVSIYEEMFDEKPKVEIIHAGLECGLLSEKIINLDCVSFGPDILDIHTTNEKLNLASAERMWKFLLELIAKKDR